MVLLSVLLRPQLWCCVQLQWWCIRERGLAPGWGLGWEVGTVDPQPVGEETKWSAAISAKGWTRGGPSLWGSLNPTGGHKKSSKVPKPDESGTRWGWLGTGACVSGAQGSSASQACGREGLSMVTHPWAGGSGDGSIHDIQREPSERKREKVHGVQQGKLSSSASVWKSTEQESRELLVLPF